MEEFRGSKGNWSYSKETGTIRGDGGLLAELLINGSENHNGTLMAAAPELLEALQRFYSWYDKIYGDDLDYTGDHPIAAAKAPIAKAIGK